MLQLPIVGLLHFQILLFKEKIMFQDNVARSFVLDFNRVNDLINLLNTDIPKRYTAPFPPTDVYQMDSHWVIRMALAGYSKDDISVSVEDEQLTVKSTKAESEHTAPIGARIIHNGISKRAFERRWKLSEGMEVVDVVLQDGMLSIGITQHIPENKKPKKFKINSTPSVEFDKQLTAIAQ